MINKTDLLSWAEHRAFCEIVRADDGPSIFTGQQPAIGSATATTGITGAPQGYVNGPQDNPDAAPSLSWAFYGLLDPLYRYREGGGALAVGGYPNQALGFQAGEFQTAEFAPAALSAVNLAALQANVANAPLSLVSVSGAGITVLAAAFTVLNTGLIVPAATLRIGANPAWLGFSQSGAFQIWTGAGVGRCVSLTSTSNLSAINYTIRGYDLYGRPQSEVLAGPNNATVNSLKGYKWITSITPSATNAGQVSVGTADKFQFPLRAGRFWETTIYWNDTLITASTGFVGASALATADPRGTYAIQGAASDGTIRLQIVQRITPANLNNQPTGIFGVTPS